MAADSSFRSDLDHLEKHGYVVLHNPYGDERFSAIAATSYRLERERGTKPGTDANNTLDGVRTLRTMGLIAHDRIYDEVALQPRILALVEALLGTDCLFGSMNLFTIMPGETIQPLHSDHPLQPRRLPGLVTTHFPLGVVAVLAVSDFTEANGATRIVPGSHKWEPISWEPLATVQPNGHEDLGSRVRFAGHDAAVMPAEMRRGDVLLFDARLWHGGGANRTQHENRAGLLFAYWPGWMRPDENNLLLPKERIRAMPQRLQELIGLSRYEGHWGHMGGRDPMEWLVSDGP